MRILLLVAAVVLALPLHAEPVLRVAGSSTVRGLLDPLRGELESASHRRIEFSSTGSIAGLLALAAGTADMTMLSMPLEDAARAINLKTPGRIDVASLHAERIGETRTVFLVNPRNPVRALTSAQLAAVLSGQVQNWKEVGGDDMPVLVVSLGSGGTFLDAVLKGRAVAANARVVMRASQIAAIVAEQPNAIGIVGASHPRGQTTVLQTDAVVAAPLLLVTRGEPGPELAAIVTHARTALAAAQKSQD